MDAHGRVPQAKTAVLALVLAAALGAGCASRLARPGDVALDAPEVELPVRWLSEEDLITTAVHIGEGGPFTFLLDTGAGVVFVTPEVARWSTSEPGVLFLGMKAKDVAGTPITTEGHVRFDSMRTGGVEFRDLDAIVMDLSDLSARLGTRIDGLLGYPVFSGGLLEVDYPAKKVRFTTTALGPVDHVEVFPLAEDHAPLLDLQLGDLAFRVLLDTAYSGVLTLGELPPADRIASGPVAAIDNRGLAGAIRNESLIRLRGPLRLGPVSLVDPVARIGKVGVVGTGVLRHFRVSLDLAHGCYSVEGPHAMRFAPVTGTGAWLNSDAEGLVVLQVLPGSPAEEAGLREGDRVLSVNGLLPGEESARRINQLMSTKGAVLRMRVLREEGEIVIEVPVIELIP